MKSSRCTRGGCVFCKKSELDELDFGELKVTKNLQVHYYCLLFSETITQSGRDNQGILGFLASDILSELRRAKQKRCHYCKEYGATAGCTNKFCNIKFHLSCGLQNRTQHNFDTFTSYCHKHSKHSNVPHRIRRAISTYKCVICLENFPAKADTDNVIWADCCKADILVHLRCMKRLAQSAGYFTKCPGCNNKSEFITTIKRRGVFVPERDASWELSRDAYSELYYVHETCDAERCLCPHGEKYSSERGKWKYFLCKLCGSTGTHQFCSNVRKEFICGTCKTAGENAPPVLNIGSSGANNNNHDNTSNIRLSRSNSSNLVHSACRTSGTDKKQSSKEEIDPSEEVIVVDCSDDEMNEPNKKINCDCNDRMPRESRRRRSGVLNRLATSEIETTSSCSLTVQTVPTIENCEKHSLECTDSSDSCKSESTTKLSFAEHDNSDLDDRINLEAISSFEDCIEVVLLDYDDENTDSNIKETTVANDAICGADSETGAALDRLNSPGLSDVLTASKPTMKVPPLKRKWSNVEKTTLQQNWSGNYISNFNRTNQIIQNANMIFDMEQLTKKFRRNTVNTISTKSKSTSRLRSLIKKVHTVVDKRSVSEGSNFAGDCDAFPVDLCSTDGTPELCDKENQQQYCISLDTDGEIEFVNLPSFSVNAQDEPCQE